MPGRTPGWVRYLPASAVPFVRGSDFRLGRASPAVLVALSERRVVPPFAGGRVR